MYAFQRAIVVTLAFAWTIQSAGADDQLYQQRLPSTVWIVAGESSGSGALIDTQDRLVVTNYHVVSAVEDVRVCFPVVRDGVVRAERDFYVRHMNELAIPGKVVRTDPRRDLALIQLATLPPEAVAVPLAETSPAPGEVIHSIGNPGTSEALWVYNSGTVRQAYEVKTRMADGIPLQARVIETQAPVNRGDSGAPAFNDKGELVGIVQAYHSDAQLMSRCIDVSELRAMLRGESRTWDVRVAQALESMELKYSTNAFGVFRLFFVDEGEETPTVIFIDSATNQVGSLEIREVRALLFTSDQPLAGVWASILLERNFQYSLGMWSLSESDGVQQLFFGVRLDANAPPDQLRDAMGHILQVAKGESELLGRLRAAQSTNPDALLGTWIGQTKDEHGSPVRIQLVFAAGGSFSMDNETFLARGSYRVVDGEVQVRIGAQRHSLGPLRFDRPDHVTLDLGAGDMAFTRVTVGEAVPSDGETTRGGTTAEVLALRPQGQGG